MIAILLNDASFEQDIRELLMAFYPGETFTHKEEEAGEAELIVRGVRDGNSFSLDVTPVKTSCRPGRQLVFTGCDAGEERSRSLCFDLSGFFQPF